MSGGGGDTGRGTAGKAAGQDHVSTFVSVKPLDIF